MMKTIDDLVRDTNFSGHDLAGEIKPATRDVIDFAKVRDSLKHLETLHYAKKAAADAYGDAVTAVAAKAGIDKQALGSFVAARCVSFKSARNRLIY